MFRRYLAGAAGLACLGTAAHAQSNITGGGTGLTSNVYPQEYSKFNPGSAFHPPGRPPQSPPATFSTYWAAGSAIGQQAFFANDLTCDIDAVTGANGGACVGPAGGAGNTVSYAASDAVFDAAQIATWATSTFGQSAARNLIQLPSMGAATAIAVKNKAITKNGALTLSDNDLCGVFSGKIADFEQITDSAVPPAPGPIAVYVRTDAAGTSFWLTNHLAAVCTQSNSNISFTATSQFASLFPSGLPANFVGLTGDNAIPSAMAGCGGPVPSALGYVSPDYTTIDPKSGATLSCTINGSDRSKLLVAGVLTGATAYTPTVANIVTGLTHPAMGSNLTPPHNAKTAANPLNWVPLVQTVSDGYPIVGYTIFGFAQCYADPNVPAALTSYISAGATQSGFLKLHYGDKAYQAIENANGFATLHQTAKTHFYAKILANMLANMHGWNTDIGNPGACMAFQGR
jgi:ABC-type phosphate transport system substrate-binding protein